MVGVLYATSASDRGGFGDGVGINLEAWVALLKKWRPNHWRLHDYGGNRRIITGEANICIINGRSLKCDECGIVKDVLGVV